MRRHSHPPPDLRACPVDAILQAIDEAGSLASLKDLARRASNGLPAIQHVGEVQRWSWYTTTVKLDLEAGAGADRAGYRASGPQRLRLTRSRAIEAIGALGGFGAMSALRPGADRADTAV